MDVLNLPMFLNNKEYKWLSCIFTVIFYSQGIRKLLLNQVKNWDTKNKFLMILKKFLKNYKNPTKLKDIFKKFNSNVLLLEMIKSFNLNKDLNINTFISDLFYYLNIINGDLLYTDKTYFLNLIKMIKYNNLSEINFNQDKTYNKNVLEYNNELIYYNTPDVLIVFFESINDSIVNDYNILKKKYKKNINNFKLNWNDPISTKIYLKNHFKKLFFYNSEYKLEASIADVNNNFVAGITHNNNYYFHKNSCPMVKYDWTNINKKDNKEICFDDNCKQVHYSDYKKDNCFSIGNNNVILFYTKVKYTKGFLGFGKKQIISKTPSLSSKSDDIQFDKYLNIDIIKELHNIDNLTVGELIDKIRIYDKKFNALSLKLKELKQIYLTKLLKYKYYDKSLSSSKSSLSSNSSLRNSMLKFMELYRKSKTPTQVVKKTPTPIIKKTPTPVIKKTPTPVVKKLPKVIVKKPKAETKKPKKADLIYYKPTGEYLTEKQIMKKNPDYLK